jgi:hypothetical protein
MHGRPLTQKQLASLLAPFCITSGPVHPPGLPDGKGYRRADFEGAWRAYCPGLQQIATFEAPKRPNADEAGTSYGLQSVRKTFLDGSKTQA